MAIGILYSKGLTLNGITLFSLVLSLGLLVDTSIIILEGFYENFYDKKMTAEAAALEAIRIYRWPLVSGTLTTVAAFVPMLLTSGIMGEYLKFIPYTVTSTLLASLIFAICFSPAIASRVFSCKEQVKKED